MTKNKVDRFTCDGSIPVQISKFPGGNNMKMLLLVLSMLPVIAMASDDFDIPGTPTSDDELADVVGDLANKCARSSDMWCYGKAPGSLCIADPRSGRSGFCNQRGQPDSEGRVSCFCY